MLDTLRVKNLALIEEEEIFFQDGLNILTGETGAGKSIILGALSMAMGSKVEKNMLRDGKQEAYAEAVFRVDDKALEEKLAAMDIEVYDKEVILSRKISMQRSVAKINGESVPAKKLKEAGALLLDIYGQQEHVSLLRKNSHLALLDEYAKDVLSKKKQKLSDAYKAYRQIASELEGLVTDETEREKELLFLRHEEQEIESARLVEGEDEECEEEYRRLSYSQKIMAGVQQAYQALNEGGAADAIGRALREISSVSEYDHALEEMESSLADVDSLLSDLLRDLTSYSEQSVYDGERFAQLEERLNLINHLKDKYGSTISKIQTALEDRRKRIEELEDYDRYYAQLKERKEKAEKELLLYSQEVSSLRKDAAKKLCEEVKRELSDLNFLDVSFAMEFARTKEYTANGIDDAYFVIAMNPGSKPAPLQDIASGGELSRIMLAMKTVLARGDAIDTLIFDEIDAGISGRTAQAVAEKLKRVSLDHQVICITHLPQIAAQADAHFRIEKHLESDATISSIHPLDEEGAVEELARMLGGAEITEAVLLNARELRQGAKR